MRVGLDVSAGGRIWSIDRDLDAGTLRIVDRDRGLDATHEFLRAGGKDAFGETVTGGLGEPLFRATAYVKQNVLDTDRLEAGLTVELARIADSGGGEASVVRALKASSRPAARCRARRGRDGLGRHGDRAPREEIEALKRGATRPAQKRREAARRPPPRLSGRERAHDEAPRAAEVAALAGPRGTARARGASRRRPRRARKRHETEREARELAPGGRALLGRGARATWTACARSAGRGRRPSTPRAPRWTPKPARARRATRRTIARRFGAASRSGTPRAGLEALLRSLAGSGRSSPTPREPSRRNGTPSARTASPRSSCVWTRSPPEDRELPRRGRGGARRRSSSRA